MGISQTQVAASVGPLESPMVRIEARRRWLALDLAELWAYRELLYFFVWRDIKVRYKQTVIGAAWAVLQPVLTMLVFSLFFGKLAKIPSQGLPYPIFYYSALLDFAISFGVFLIMMVYYGMVPTAAVIWLPAFLLLAVLTALGVGLWLSALNALYRDVRYVVPFLVQFWMFASPVAYPSSLISVKWRWLYGLNPMAGVIEGFRWSLAGSGMPSGRLILVSSCVVIVVLLSGVAYFQKMETTIADVV